MICAVVFGACLDSKNCTWIPTQKSDEEVISQPEGLNEYFSINAPTPSTPVLMGSS